MIGQRLGCVRVSSLNRNPNRQFVNVPGDRVCTAKAAGKDGTRPPREAEQRVAREGETVVVHALDRRARHLAAVRRLGGVVIASARTL